MIERAAGFLIFDGIPNKKYLPQNRPSKLMDDFKFRKREPTGKLEKPVLPPGKPNELPQPVAAA